MPCSLVGAQLAQHGGADGRERRAFNDGLPDHLVRLLLSLVPAGGRRAQRRQRAGRSGHGRLVRCLAAATSPHGRGGREGKQRAGRRALGVARPCAAPTWPSTPSMMSAFPTTSGSPPCACIAARMPGRQERATLTCSRRAKGGWLTRVRRRQPLGCTAPIEAGGSGALPHAGPRGGPAVARARACVAAPALLATFLARRNSSGGARL